MIDKTIMSEREKGRPARRSRQTDEVFGVVTQVKTFRSLAPLPTESYGLAKGIGLTFEAEAWDGGYRNTHLVYARIGGHEYGRLIGAISQPRQVPTGFALYQNYPDPFNPTATIVYDVPAFTHVSIRIFDVLGREVRTIVDGYKSPGKYEVEFDAGNLASGVYFYRITAGKFTQSRKMLLIK